MFRKTDPQRSLFECEFLLPPVKAERLRKSWAEQFRQRVLPLIDEEVMRNAFSESMGAPNKSIRLMTGLHLLKEWNDLTDEQVLDQLEYNLQWHYALGITAEEAHTCQKSLHNHRVRLMVSERAREMFVRVTRALAEADKLDLGLQRLDSTHVLSNIAVLTRLGLFVETVTHFLRELRKRVPEQYASLDRGYGRRYLEREGYFSDAKREQARRRLPVVAQDVYELVRAFELKPEVEALESYQTLERLLDEQCEIVAGDESGDDDGDDGEGGGGSNGGDERLRVKPREPKTIQSDSLQSPHDPDASYGHKGKGYEVQVSETCVDGNPYQVVTGTRVGGAHESDQGALLPMLDQLEEDKMKPEGMEADTGYGSGENIVESARRGVTLIAPVQDPDAPERSEHFAAPVCDEPPTDDGSADQDEPAAAEGVDEPGSEEEKEPQSPLGMASFTFTPTFEHVLSCPAGQSPAQQELVNGQVIAKFSSKHCTGCPQSSRCPTRELANGDRQLRRSPATIATERRQVEQQTAEFKDLYRKRSGLESTNMELKDRHGLGDLRVRGRRRVEVSAWLKATALNVKRSVQYHVQNRAQCALCPC